jgi:cytoskeletal protein RodZ
VKQHVETGIGRALRRARESRGKSLEDASRETRVRIDYLRAIEHEWFGALGSDVYVRGFLRSYARYLGLSSEKVVDAYERAFGTGIPAPAPVEQSPTVTPSEALVLTERKRPNWLLAGGAAVILLASAAAIGLIGRTDSVPEPAGLEPPPVQPIVERPVEVGILAHAPVELEVIVDGGEPETASLEEGESVSYQGEDSIEVSASEGGLFGLVVNGHEIREAGERRAPFDMVYTPDDFRGKREGERSTPATPDG